VQRDREMDDLLLAAGWLSIRVWEHEDLESAAIHIAEIVRQRREDPGTLPKDLLKRQSE
jgi:DNA mismatch endonuclease (patch repair protein)